MRMILLTTVILFGLGTSLYQVKTGIDERQDHLRRVEFKIANTNVISPFLSQNGPICRGRNVLSPCRTSCLA